MTVIYETEADLIEPVGEGEGELSPVPAVSAVASCVGLDLGDDIASLGVRLREQLDQGYLWYQRYRNERDGNTYDEDDVLRCMKHGASSHVDWNDLSMVSEVDAEEGALLWQRIRADAARDLRSGHRAARSCEVEEDGPMQRAQFLEVRRAFIESWQPHGGLEVILIDQMTEAYTQQLHWTAEFSKRSRESASFDAEEARSRRNSEREGFRWGSWTPPRQKEADAIAAAFEMADKWNRIFLRVLRQLRDLRRYTPPVIINNGGQINVGQQQVNTAKPVALATPKRRKRRASSPVNS